VGHSPSEIAFWHALLSMFLQKHRQSADSSRIDKDVPRTFGVYENTWWKKMRHRLEQKERSVSRGQAVPIGRLMGLVLRSSRARSCSEE
jgi:hypothetical protein